VIEEEKSIFWEVVVSIIVRKKSLYKRGYWDRAVWIYSYSLTFGMLLPT